MNTPDKSFNIMLNGIAYVSKHMFCRLWSLEVILHQCVGAFGFRDQLQDVYGSMLLRF